MLGAMLKKKILDYKLSLEISLKSKLKNHCILNANFLLIKFFLEKFYQAIYAQ